MRKIVSPRSRYRTSCKTAATSLGLHFIATYFLFCSVLDWAIVCKTFVA